MSKMKFVFTSLVAVVGFMFAMIGVDVLVHDETLAEAWKGYPHQFIRSLSSLFALAWQYKFVTFIFCAIAMAVLYVRVVPPIKNQ
ncbi:MAG TPA: hypothetical protein VFB04_00320 [Terriglobales bacterium]|nr:hypothetical protein [Terriglobales bacterium]